MRQFFGSQIRDPYQEAGYEIVRNGEFPNEKILRHIETGNKELWIRNDCHAGYTLEIDGIGYEFVHSLKERDKNV
jgi:hypothetical protein